MSAEELHIEPEAVSYLREPLLLSFAKAAQPSRVHRPAYPDFVSIRELNNKGQVVKECRFMGLYTSAVYAASVNRIPYIRRKVAETPFRLKSGEDLRVTMSGGISTSVEDEDIDHLLKRADDALYQAKSNGRNRVELHESAAVTADEQETQSEPSQDA